MDYTMPYSQQPCEANSIAVSTSQMRKLSLLIINAIAAHSEAPTRLASSRTLPEDSTSSICEVLGLHSWNAVAQFLLLLICPSPRMSPPLGSPQPPQPHYHSQPGQVSYFLPQNPSCNALLVCMRRGSFSKMSDCALWSHRQQ